MFKIGKKISVISIIVIVVITISTICYATAVGDLQDKVDDIEKQQSEAIKRYNILQKDIGIYKGDVESIDKDITKYQGDVDSLSAKAGEINKEVGQLEAELQDASNSFTATKDLLNTRLRALYENGFVNVWDVLFSSNGVTDFLAKYNVVISLLEYDKKILNAMQNQKEYIANKKQDTELRKLQIEQVQYDVEKSQQALESSKAAKETKITQLTNSQKELEELKAKLQKEEEETQKQLEIELAKIKVANITFNGKFGWPVPGFTYISAHFGKYDLYNTGNYTNHYGMDIAGSGIYGKPIVAAETGKVVLAKWYSGYGNCVIIDHGKSLGDGATYRTIYGHASSILVTEGQMVARGQKIALVGSTGNSTGPHLHFELKKNGTSVNPYPYLK